MRMNYKDAGVNIGKANEFISQNLAKIHSTYTQRVITNKNNFAGLYDLTNIPYKNPVLAVSCDGIGSKIKLATAFDSFYNLGLDIVANNVNDILCSGVDPILFLDYYACGKLKRKNADSIMQGIVDACLWSNISLIGGETAELPLTYKKSDFDLVGTAIGIVDKDAIYDPNNVRAGDILIGIKSSGPHSNGYSLINKIIKNKSVKDYSLTWNVADQLLEPTKNYQKVIKVLKENVAINGLANITGGGMIDNIPRILPKDLMAVIDLNAYERPKIFNWIQIHGNVDENEMRKVFNLGIGMVLCIAKEDVDDTLGILGEDGIKLGYVIKKINEKSIIFFGEY